MMSVAMPFLEQQMHPTVIIGAYRQCLEDLITILREKVSVPVDPNNRDQMLKIIRSSLGTKFIKKWWVTGVTFNSLWISTPPYQFNSKEHISMKFYANLKTFSFKKMYLKLPSANCWPFILGLRHKSGSTLVQAMSSCLSASIQIPGPILTNHQRGLVAFTWGQFHRKCSSYLSLTCIWKLLLWYYSHISQGPVC